MIQRLKFRGKVVKPIELGSIFTGGNEIPIGEWIVAPSNDWNLGVFFTYVTLGNIDPSTVGQWTGLKDSKGVEIWEGDRYFDCEDKSYDPDQMKIYEIKFNAESGGFEAQSPRYHKRVDCVVAMKRIGTIHDKEQA